MPADQSDESEPHQLSQALRELIEVVRTADLNGVDLSSAIAQVRSLRDLLQPRVVTGVRMQSALHYDAWEAQNPLGGGEVLGPSAGLGREHPSDFFPYSPVVGPLNPVSPPATMTTVATDDGFEVHGEVTFSAAFNGPPDCVHGGVIAALFDELLGSCCVVNGIGGYTGTLTVVYRSPTPLGKPLQMRGWHDRSEGRKAFVEATLHSGDTLCAQANGIFVQSDTLRNPMR